MAQLNEDLNKAIVLAVNEHRGQTDKQGEPYILHPLRVMLSMPTKESAVVAMLHDIVEDTDMELPYLHSMGFSEEVVQAVGALTRYDGEDYQEYVRRVGDHPLARAVKIGDLKDNLDESRGPIPESLQKRYKEALAYLTA